MSGTQTRRFDRIDVGLALALFAVTTIIVGISAQSLGFTRDEGYYFKAAESYWGWFAQLGAHPQSALSAASIDKYWSYNHEHPAGMKTLMALSYGINAWANVMATHNALRLPAWIMAGTSVALVYALGRAVLPRAWSVFAAALWVTMPHVFWHMHVACFDIGIAAAHAALVLSYWHARRSNRGAWIAAVVFAAAATIKHNVLPVPALCVLHWLLCDATPATTSATTDATRVRLGTVPLVFVLWAVVSPLLYVAHWPWLWPDPARRFGGYIAYHLSHEHYPILYFGELLTQPPFPVHFPFVMSAVTIPVPTLMLMLLGTALASVAAARTLWHRRVTPLLETELTRVPFFADARDPSGSAAALLLINAAYPFILIALPSTPIFGGTKHWMNALPFLCVLGAWALAEISARLRALNTSTARANARAMAAAAIAIALLCVAPGAVISARVWPYGLGSYNELIGFARGAANVGMQRTFWGYEPMEALAAINAGAAKNGRIHFGDTNQDSWRMYQRDGLLRADIGWSNTVRGASVASVQPQGEFKDQWMDVWNDWGTRSPDLVTGAEGVPALTVTFAPKAKP